MVEICNLSFFDFLEDLFFIIDMDCNIIETNKSVLDKLGYTNDELTGTSISRLFPKLDICRMLQGTYESKRTPILTKTGSRFFIIKSMKMHMRCTDTDYILIVARDVDIEEKYRNIFNNSVQGIFQTTLDGKYITINNSFAKLSGYDSPDEMMNTNATELYFHQEDRKRFLEGILKDGYVKDAEGLMLKKNGDKIWVSCSANSIFDEEGNILYIDGMIEDITNRKEVFNNYQSLLNAIPDMMARIRYDGRIMDIKPGEGIYSDEGQSTPYLGMNVTDLPFGPVIPEEFRKIVEEVIIKNEPIEFCYSLTINGNERHYYSRTVKNSDNEVIVIVRDRTDETNISRELRNSKDFAENLMDTANVMVVGLDLKGNVSIFNSTAEHLTGYKREEVMGKNWFNEIPILIKDDVPRVNNVFNDITSDNAISNEVENPIITKDGEIKYVLWRNNEIRENGVVVGTISFGLDISDRKKFEQELIESKNKAEQSDKMKLEFLANMSHDLRTPMNSIIGFSDLLKSNNLTKHEKHDYLNTIINNGKFLMALIDDIIDISKIDAGNLKIENNEFEINKLMEDLRSTYFKQIKDKKLDIIIDIDVNKNIIINTDKYRLKQVMMNLIGNAIKFTQDGYVKFGYKVINSRQLEVYVEDTGIGIERQYQKVIFERFKQIGKNNKFKGAGLGLSITKSLVELLGFKEIRLISELEKGSKFYFYVPYTVKHYNYINEVRANRKNKKMNFAGKNILLVEDTAESRIIIKSYLAPTNATVIEVMDGLKVMDIIKSTHIDLVLLDLGLPTIDGYEVLRRIREYSDRLPVIIESALVMPDQKSKAFELGCDDFISKPFIREDFLNKIDNLI